MRLISYFSLFLAATDEQFTHPDVEFFRRVDYCENVYVVNLVCQFFILNNVIGRSLNSIVYLLKTCVGLCSRTLTITVLGLNG